MVSRRAFVAGGAGPAVAALTGGALVEEGVLPGKVRLDRAIGRCRTLPAPPATPGVVRTRTFRSRFRGTDVTAAVVLPAGVTSLRGLPVAVALHGNGGSGQGTADGMHLDRYLTEAVGGRPPFAVVAVDGGPGTYWHRRANGEDPIAMIIRELPLPAREGDRPVRGDRLVHRRVRSARVGRTGWEHPRRPGTTSQHDDGGGRIQSQNRK